MPPTEPPVDGRWAAMTPEQQRAWLDWLVTTCLMFGTSLGTAYRVAAEFADGADRDAHATIRARGPANA